MKDKKYYTVEQMIFQLERMITKEYKVKVKQEKGPKNKRLTGPIPIVECDEDRNIICIHESHIELSHKLGINTPQFLCKYIRGEVKYKGKYYLMSNPM